MGVHRNVDRSQADAIVQAILEPDLKVQEEIRRKRAADERGLAEGRKIAVFMLVGFAIGALSAYLMEEGISAGGLWAGIVSAVIGRLIISWRSSRRPA